MLWYSTVYHIMLFISYDKMSYHTYSIYYNLYSNYIMARYNNLRWSHGIYYV